MSLQAMINRAAARQYSPRLSSSMGRRLSAISKFKVYTASQKARRARAMSQQNKFKKRWSAAKKVTKFVKYAAARKRAIKRALNNRVYYRRRF